MAETRIPEELEALAKGYRRVPLWKSIPARGRTATDVFLALKNLSRQCFILESLEDPGRWGRYTFIGYDPKLEISCTNGTLCIKNGTELRIETDKPGSYIRRIIEDNRCPPAPDLPPFTGGLVGYFSYDYIKYSEGGLNLDAEDEEGFKDADLMLFDKLVVFDNREGRILIIINISVDALEENYRRA
ncbi:MAG: anthranilate synthase component I, partial [Spirochaetaceae bacterium]|nr:anthranilate synthase component I [Spirochaetaceae bacterium]